MNKLKSSALMFAAALLAVSAAVAAAKPVTLELKLPPKPPVPPPEMAALLTAGPLTLTLSDARGADDPAVVGAQRAKGEDVYLWRASQPVAPAVQELATQMLNTWSVRVAPDAEFGLRLELLRFYVTERSETFGSNYVAEVHFKVAFVDKAGNVLWAGEASGTAKRPGVDARASMCNEALSVALRGALAQALSSIKLETASPVIHAPTSPAVPVAPVVEAAPGAIEPAALLADLTRLKAGGVADDVLVGYVEQRKLARALTVDEILQWKNAGIPDAAIKAATRP
jgi:hypothetical protein